MREAAPSITVEMAAAAAAFAAADGTFPAPPRIDLGSSETSLPDFGASAERVVAAFGFFISEAHPLKGLLTGGAGVPSGPREGKASSLLRLIDFALAFAVFGCLPAPLESWNDFFPLAFVA